MRRTQVVSLGAVLAWALSGWLSAKTLAEDNQEALPTRSSRVAPGTSAQQNIEDKLTQLKAQQEEIMKQMDKLFEELQIVKTRTTLH